MSDLIPVSSLERRSFTPPSLALIAKVTKEKAPEFELAVPTFAMRDRLQSILFRAGLIPATLVESRSILIDALYRHYDDAEADKIAADFENFWTRQSLHDELQEGWAMQEAQRRFDEAHGAEKQDPLPPPPPTFTPREQSRFSRYVTDMMRRDEFYRDYQARFTEQRVDEDDFIGRIFVTGWKNVGPTKCKRVDSMVEAKAVEGMRGYCVENGWGDPWPEVVRDVRSMMGGTERTRKNSDSLLDTSSNPTGSSLQNDASASSDGNSTGSNIEQAPDTE